MVDIRKNNNFEGNIFSGMLWMIFLSILLFWLPTIGSFIAGFIGGKKAGNLINALVAALLPSLLLGIILFSFSNILIGIPLIGVVFGLGGFLFGLIGISPLLLGAIIGGYLSE